MSDVWIPGPGFGSDPDAETYANYHELTNRMVYLAEAAPYLASDPAIMSAIAQMNVPIHQLGYIAAGTSAQINLDNTRQVLERMDTGRARSLYNQLTTQQQQALAAMGYQAPDSPDRGGGNPVLGVIGQGMHLGLSGLNYAVTKTPVVSDVFEIMNTIQNGVNTVYRNIRTDEWSEVATLAAMAGAIGVTAFFTGGLSLGATALAAGAGGLAAGTAVTALSGPSNLTNPSQWWDAMQRNWDGERVFSQAAQRRSRELLGATGLEVIARDLGWEEDLYETVLDFAGTPEADDEQVMFHSIARVVDRLADPGSPERETLYQTLLEVSRLPEFREAVGILQRSKTSFGRDIARALHVDPDNPIHRYLSGALDATFLVVTDPTLAVGSYVKWTRMRRLGVPIEPDGAFASLNAIAERANSVPTVGRAYDEIAHAIDTGQIHLLWTRVPQARGLAHDLVEHRKLLLERGELAGPYTRDNIFEWMLEGDNHQRMLAGHGVKQGQARLMLPTYGWRVPLTQYIVPVGKPIEGMRNAIYFADDAANQAHLRRVAKKLRELDPDAPVPTMTARTKVGGFDQIERIDDAEWDHLRRFIEVVDTLPVVNAVMRRTGSILASFVEMMPMSNAISLVGPQSVTAIQRLVGLGRVAGMSSTDRKFWFDTIMQQRNVEHRMNAALGFLDTLLTAGGARTTQHGSDLIDQFVRKTRHRYGVWAEDMAKLGDLDIPRAIYPYQHTFDLPIPNMSELREAIDKGLMMKYLFRVTDSEPIDWAINRVWKPAVLLRVGFITRAAGEELLAHLMRAGPSSYFNEFAARSIAEGRLHDDALQAGAALKELDPAQYRAITRMRYVAHVRPLERMFSSWNWTDPMVEYLGRYSDFLRRSLERGLLPEATRLRIPENRQLALLGREDSLRRSLLIGVDQELIETAEIFGRRHATTILREISAHNANIWSGTTIDDPAEFRLRWENSNELKELGFAVDRGKWRVYRRGDEMWDRAGHSAVSKILDDPVVGPAFTEVTTRFIPSTVDEAVATQALADMRRIEDPVLRRVMRELLNHDDPRTVNWRSMLRDVGNGRTNMAAAAAELRDRMRSLGTSNDDAATVLDILRNVARKDRFNAKLWEDEINAMESALARLQQYRGADRAWLGSHLDYWSRNTDNVRFLHNMDEYRTELARVLQDAHWDHANQPLVGSLTYANRTAAGQPVVGPLQEARLRVWVPQMSPETYGRFAAHVHAHRSMPPRDYAAQMLEQWHQALPELGDALHLEQMDDVVLRFFHDMAEQGGRRMLDHARQVSEVGRVQGVVPIVRLGVDDPRVTIALSKFLEGSFTKSTDDFAIRLRRARGTVGELDLDRNIESLVYKGVDGTSRRVAHSAWDFEAREIEPPRQVSEIVEEAVEVDAIPLPELNMRTEFTVNELRNAPKWDEHVDELIGRLDPTQTEIHFIAGGREFKDADAMRIHLRRVRQEAARRGHRVVVVHGGARGADRLAGRVARELDMHVIVFNAPWEQLPTTAGFRRNETMAAFLERFRHGRRLDTSLADRPFQVTATTFPGGTGTDHMRRQLKRSQIPTYAPATSVLPPIRNATTRTKWLPAVEGQFPTHRRQTPRRIHTWRLDEEYLHPSVVSRADAPGPVEMPDGSYRMGATNNAAVSDGVEKMIDNWLGYVGTGTEQTRVVKNVAYWDAFGRERVEIGTQLNSRDEVYDIHGEVIGYDDPEVFSFLRPTAVKDIHSNFTMTGPLLRDATDLLNDTESILTDLRDLPFLSEDVVLARSRRAPAPRNIPAPRGPGDIKYQRREFRGHWSHMNELENPPAVIVGPSYRPIEDPNAWDKVLEFGFERMISPALDAIIRRPLAFHMFAEARRENLRALRWSLHPDLFGNDRTGEAGLLRTMWKDEQADLLDKIPNRLRATEPQLREAIRVYLPDLADDIADMSPDDLLRTWYGRRAIGGVDELGDQLREGVRANATLTRGKAREHIEARLSALDSSTTLGRSLRRTYNELYPKAARLYQAPGKKWVAYKPRVEGVIAVDVRLSEVSSTLKRLNDAPTSNAALHWIGRAKPIEQMGKLERFGSTFDQFLADLGGFAFSGQRVGRLDAIANWTPEIGVRLQRQLRPLYDEAQNIKINGHTLGEWGRAYQASLSIVTPRRAELALLDGVTEDAVLKLYREALGDKLHWDYDHMAFTFEQDWPSSYLPVPTRQQWGFLQRAHRNQLNVMETVDKLSAERAIINSMPFLDSHEIRSQAGEYVRGFFPFMYAEENFLKRWARTIKIAPDALRKMQLGYMGLSSGGVIRTDSQGRDWFVYPGAGMAADLMNRTLSTLGLGEVLPSGVVFQSETKNMLPGFDIERTGMPSANPLVALPIGWLAHAFPELRPAQEALVGQVGVAQGGVSQFVPSAIRRFWDVAGDEDANRRYASAMMLAIQVLEHNGHGLPEGATRAQMDDYLRRVRNHTRGILATQAFVGFLAPGAPSLAFTGESQLDVGNLTGLGVEVPADVFRDEFITLVRELGIEEGTVEFFAQHPDVDLESLMAFTVGQTTSSSGAPLPATSEAVAFADQYGAWIEEFPMASAWLLPQPEPGDDEPFDYYAYTQQVISGLRQRRTPEEFLTQLKFKEGAFDYFQASEIKERNLAETQDPQIRRALNDHWRMWKSQHLALHPIFAEELEGGAARIRRGRVLDELRVVLMDPQMPKVRHAEPMREMVAIYDSYRLTIQQLGTTRNATNQNQIDQMKRLFSDTMTKMILDHPELEPFYLTIIKPESNLDPQFTEPVP